MPQSLWPRVPPSPQPNMSAPKNFISTPFAYHQEIELKIDTLTNHGVGLGRVEGWVVMVPYALPGDRIRARVWRNHAHYSEADIVEVLEASPERVSPQCPLFGVCGGCQYQHLAYESQLRWKQNQVAELFERLGGITFPVEKPVGSPQLYGYRSKITPHFQKPRPGEFPIGFLKQGRRQDLVDVPRCPIATDAINAALPGERAKVHSGAKKYRRGGTLLLRHTLEGVVTDPTVIASERIGKFVFQFLAGDFFQNNPFILPKLVDYVLEHARAGGAEAGGPRYLVDAYCGVGVFAICGSPHFERCAGVEINASAVRWANGNAAINRAANCEFFVGAAEAIFKEITFPGAETAMVIDPPRAGCDQAFVDQLVAFGPARVVYVSCDPATQARDVKGFLAGGYKLETLQPFDLFPQTRHIENVAVLTR